MNKYRYKINNLDCANCARKIEDSLNKNKDFKNVKVNFNTMMISYETEKNISISGVNKLIKKIEPEAYISENEENVKKEYHLSILIIALVIGLFGFYLNISKPIKLILLVISYILLLYKVFINAFKMIKNGGGINENALILISCIGAFVLGEAIEGMMVIVLYTIGKILEEKALNNSRKSIKDLMNIKSIYANKQEKDKVKTINVENVKVGDVLVVRKGEKIPVDGTIINGKTYLDTSALTGESENILVKNGDKVLSGSINNSDVITIKAISTFEDSTVSKILELLDTATDKKAKTETTISKISKVYTPIILILALIVAIFLPLISSVTYSQSIYRALTFLVISCPCAIAISVPLSYFTGIGVASKNGILIKGSNFLDNLQNTTGIIFDKTGTLTSGTFTVTDIIIQDKDYSKKDVINYLVMGETFSNHPIAKSLLKLTDKKIDTSKVKNFKETTGKGISYEIDDKKIVIGSKKVCKCDWDGTLHLNINGKHIATIEISDGIKSETKDSLQKLKELNIKTYMFTGDKKEHALKIGEKLGIDEIYYEMLPHEKFTKYEEVKKNEKTLVFVGDGVNDAPTLKRADIGISMGGVGTDSAIEASDIVLMSDDLMKIPLAINISKYTKYIINENLIFAMGIKILILLLSIFGYANMWFAVFADTGVTLLTILNTLRILRKYRKK